MKLGDLCDVVRGSSPRPKSDTRFYGGIVPRLMVADLTRDGKIVSARIDTLTELGAKQSRPMTRGDVVIAVSGAPGLPAILAHDACIHDGFVGLRDLNRKRLDADFLYAYLTFVRATSNGQAVGAIFKNLTTDQIKGIDIPELPLAEQRRIAEVLDRAEALRAKRRVALAQLDSLTQSLFLDMFGDPVVREDHSQMVEFGRLTTRITYGFTCPMEHLSEGIPIITAKNVRQGFIDFQNCHFASVAQFQTLTDKCKPEVGDLLITKDGAIRGRCAMVETRSRFCISQAVALIRPDRSVAIPEYLWGYIVTDRIQRKIMDMDKGVAMPHLQITELAKFPVLLPPISLQREFARRVTAVETLKTAHRASLAELDALFATLQHRAFRGEL